MSTALQQTRASSRVDPEANGRHARTLDHLPLQVDRHLDPGIRTDSIRKLLHHRLVQRHREETEVEAVVVEHRPEARGDDHAQPALPEPDYRIHLLAALAEVPSCKQDGGIAIRFPIEYEIRVFRAVGPVPEAGERMLAGP